MQLKNFMMTTNLIPSQIADFWHRMRGFMAKGPAYHYAYGRWRLRQLGHWVQRGYLTPPLSTHTLFADLALDQPDIAAIVKVAGQERIEEACRMLVVHFVTRREPQFHFASGVNVALVNALPAQVKQDTIRAADDICQNRFCFRNVPAVQFDGVVDWDLRPEDNVDWTWDLNRHFIFVTLGQAYQYTGDERYSAKLVELLRHWQATHPVDTRHVVWRPFEVAVRLNTWIWAFHLFLGSEIFQVQGLLDLLKGLLTHARFLANNLEYHVPNNHLLLEAKALAEAGLLFPEFTEAAGWRRVGLKVLWREVERQVEKDGVHRERSMLYQCIIASELLEMLMLLQRNGYDIPLSIRARFERMAEFQSVISRADGSYPLFNDSARHDEHIRFDACWGAAALLRRPDLVDEERFPGGQTAWLMGMVGLPTEYPKRIEANSPQSSAFPKGGYFVMRHGQGDGQLHLAFDGGPFGYKPSPGHGHADALSFEVFAYGHGLVTDSGAYRYDAPLAWRNYFRGSRAHNTVIVDNQDQSHLIDNWHVYRVAETTLHRWLATPHFDLVDASHDGYRRFPKPVVHRRRVVFVKPAYWVVIDTLVGKGDHQFDLLFHLMPGAAWQLEGNILHTENTSDVNLCIALITPKSEFVDTTVIEGATDPIQGWVSLYSGQKEPSPVLRYRHIGPTPTHFISLLCPYRALERFPCQWKWLGGETGKSTAFNIIWTGSQGQANEEIAYFLVKSEASMEMLQCGPYQSDAELLIVRAGAGNQEPEVVLMDNGCELIGEGQSLVRQPAPARGYYMCRIEGELISEEVEIL